MWMGAAVPADGLFLLWHERRCLASCTAWPSLGPLAPSAVGSVVAPPYEHGRRGCERLGVEDLAGARGWGERKEERLCRR